MECVNVTEPLLVVAFVFSVHLMPGVEPVPITLIQLLLETEAVHEPPCGVDTLTSLVSPAARNVERFIGETLSVYSPCSIFKVCFTFASRLCTRITSKLRGIPVFCVQEKVMEPLVVPLVADIVSHAGLEVTFCITHPEPEGPETVTLTVWGGVPVGAKVSVPDGFKRRSFAMDF